MVVDMEVPGLPLQVANPAAIQLTGYSKDEMVGRNCRFLRNDDQGCYVNGRERKAPELRAIRRSITEARTVVLKVLNYRKDGTPFENILSLHPVHHSTTQAYCYSIGLQAAYDPTAADETRALQLQRLEQLRQLLPTVFISEADATRFEQAAAVDATSVGERAKLKFEHAMERETLVMLTQLACAIDVHAALRHLVSLQPARDALQRWLQQRAKAADPRLAALTALIEAPHLAERDAASQPGAVAAPILAEDGLLRFVASKEVRPLLEMLLAVDRGLDATSSGLVWQEPSPSATMQSPATQQLLLQLVALGRAIPLMFTIGDPQTGALLFANDAYYQATEQSPEDALGMPWRAAHSATSAIHANATIEQALADQMDCVLDLTLTGCQHEGLPALAAIHSFGASETTASETPASDTMLSASLLVAIYVHRPSADHLAVQVARKLAKLLRLLPDPPLQTT